MKPMPRHDSAASRRAGRLRRADAVERAARMIMRRERPLVMLGAAGNRPRLAEPLVGVRAADAGFRSSIPRWARAPSTRRSDLYMGTAALSERDYVHEAIDQADLIIAIGHDTVEKPPFLDGSTSGPHGHACRLSCRRMSSRCTSRGRDRRRYRRQPAGPGGPPRRQTTQRARRCWRCAKGFSRTSPSAPTEDRFPLTPQRLVHDVRAGHAGGRHRLPSTTACTRSGSRAITAPASRTRCCSTTRSRPWAQGCLPPSWRSCSIRTAACSPCAATAAS